MQPFLGFLYQGEGIHVPILQYADDTLFLIENDLEMLHNVKAMFLWFEEASGLHVNNAKTKLFRLNGALSWNDLLGVWDCRPGCYRIPP